MTAADFRRLALSLPGSAEGEHMGTADFRVGGRIFATLAAEQHGLGNLMLTPMQQAEFVAERPDLFVPVKGGWGRMGATHLVLERAYEAVAVGALHAAYTARIQANAKAATRRASPHRTKTSTA